MCGVPVLYFRKQVDDAFDAEVEVSARTLGQRWLDSVDVDDDGLPKPKAETLLAKLTRLGLGPNDAVGTFCGVVTNRCVASSLLHAVKAPMLASHPPLLTARSRLIDYLAEIATPSEGAEKIPLYEWECKVCHQRPRRSMLSPSLHLPSALLIVSGSLAGGR